MVAVREQVGDLEAERGGDALRRALVRVAVEDGSPVGSYSNAEGSSVVAVMGRTTRPELVLGAARLAAVGLERVPEQAQGSPLTLTVRRRPGDAGRLVHREDRRRPLNGGRREPWKRCERGVSGETPVIAAPADGSPIAREAFCEIEPHETSAHAKRLAPVSPTNP
jgi:hypothetical protein